MNTQIEIHPAQAIILRELLFKPIAKFAELNKTELTNDHFTFHIKRLRELGLVEKTKGMYSLTSQGKEFANRMDTETTKIERQAKIAVLVVAVKDNTILIQQRLKQPYYGYHGFITGKVRWGETVSEAAEREFMEEAGLNAKKFELVGIEHKLDIKDKVTQEDKFFYIVKVTEPEGELIEQFEGGRNIWMTKTQIANLDKKFGDIPDILKIIRGTKLRNFVEKEYVVEEY